MRTLTAEEIIAITKKAIWASIITVRPDGVPFAIEATPFYTDTETCFMINPGGGTSKNLRSSPHVLLKYTFATPDLKAWMGISCLGSGRFVHDPHAIRLGWELLGKVMGQDFSGAADKYCQNPGRSPLMAVKIHSRTGRCSAVNGTPLSEIYASLGLDPDPEP
ncbi:MAG: hypothetical protein LBF58_08425 [Deltaproteobacteria bacterium]|jgi:hypothetical protein|nr:hypothetical protein [Deltaproteobacteria bacterium]